MKPDGKYWLDCGIDDEPVTVINGRVFGVRVPDAEIIEFEGVNPNGLTERPGAGPYELRVR